MRELLRTEQARFISEKKKKTLCFKNFQTYPEKIIKNFDQNGFIVTTTKAPLSQGQSTSLVSLAFAQQPVEVKTNISRIDKKFLSSGTTEIKNRNSYFNNQTFIDIIQRFSSVLFFFIFPTTSVFIVILILAIFVKKHFENRIQYRLASPIVA